MTQPSQSSDPHHGHVAHSISESCIPQCPRYQYPRSATRMKAHTDPSWAIDRILELEARVERLGHKLVLFGDFIEANCEGAEIIGGASGDYESMTIIT